MTKEQKEQITQLRLGGSSYSEIAKALDVALSAVKAHCRRHCNPMVTQCENCGKQIKQTPHRKKKRFCCNKCHNEWWSKHADQLNKKAYYDLTCACCGKEFRSYGDKDRKYCSRECYLHDRFHREKE